MMGKGDKNDVCCQTHHNFFLSGTHWSGDIGPGGYASGARFGLFDSAVPLPATTTASARPLVLLPNVQVPALLLLQELRLHRVPLLVRFLLWLQRPGEDFLDHFYKEW